jgi:hypothetical protein
MPKLKFLGALPVDSKSVEQSLFQHFYFSPAAAAADFEVPLIGLTSGAQLQNIDSVNIITSADVTNNATNYVTLQLIDRGPSGSGTAVLATINTDASTGKIAKYTRTALTMAGTALIAKGDFLALVATHGGAGVALPGFCIEVLRTQ